MRRGSEGAYVMLGALLKLRPTLPLQERARVIGVWRIERHRRLARLVRADV